MVIKLVNLAQLICYIQGMSLLSLANSRELVVLKYIINSYLSYCHKLFYHQNIHIIYQMDHTPDVSFHSPCEKDLRISYLEQYQLNGSAINSHIGYEANKEKTKCTLKDITDKYGFYWDQQGKLSKHTRKIKQNQLPSKKTSKKDQRKYQQQVKQNRKKYTQKILVEQKNYNVKPELSQIDARINRIVDKYKKNNSSTQEAKLFTKKFGRQQKQNAAKDYQIEESQDIVQIPYFGTQNSQDEQNISKQNSIIFNRSRSQIKLSKPKPKLNISVQNNQQQKRQFNSNKLKQRPYYLTAEKRKASSISIKDITDKQSCLQLDNKISSITSKIKQFQKQKQQLNIQFKRFEYKSSEKVKTPQKFDFYRRPNIDKQFNFASKNQQIKQSKQKYIERIDLSSQKRSQNTRINRSKIIMNQIKQQINDKTSISINQDDEISIFSKSKYATPEKIQMKKPKRSILAKLCRQLQLDEQFRNAKLWFEKNSDPHKWGILADRLAVDGPSYSYFTLVQKFNCLPSEHNPFFSAKQNNQNYASLISKYKSYENHWAQQLQKKFDIQDLEIQEFTSRQLDIQQKAFIKIQDLVRFVNMRTKNFYRTRDFVLIFQRFAGKEKQEIHFSRILEVFIK